MYRTMLALAIGLLAAVSASADVRPPAGYKRVPIDHKFTTEKEYPDYLFFTYTGVKGLRARINAVTIDPKTPGLFPGAKRTGVGRLGYLVAVPKDAAKNYGTEKEFHDAIKTQTVQGMLMTTTKLDSFTTLKESDTRTVIVREHVIEKVDPKGIVLKSLPAAEPKAGEKKDSPNAAAPRVGTAVAGLAAFAAITLGGLWLAGRGRRKA